MNRIYMYTKVCPWRPDAIEVHPSEFNADKLKSDVPLNDEFGLNKPATGLWSCPFGGDKLPIEQGGKRTYTWEDWTLVERDCMFTGRESERYEDYSDDKMVNRIRNNAFFFAVDQSKILHVYSDNDVQQFISRGHFGGRSLDFEGMRQAGYSGIEVHDKYTGYTDSVFWGWDVASLVVWDPKCVTPVDREIANICRIVGGQYSYRDNFDKTMQADYLAEWIQNNGDKIQEAIDKKVFSSDDVQFAVASLDYLRSSQRDAAQQLVLDIKRGNQMIQKLIEENQVAEQERRATYEYKLATYCIDNNLQPVILSNLHLENEQWGTSLTLGDIQPGDVLTSLSGDHMECSPLAPVDDADIQYMRENGIVVRNIYPTVIGNQETTVIETDNMFIATDIYDFSFFASYAVAINDRQLSCEQNVDELTHDDMDGIEIQ